MLKLDLELAFGTFAQVRKALARSNGAHRLDQSLAATPLGPTQDKQQASQQHLQTKPVYHVQGHGQRRTAQTVPINGSTSTFLSLIGTPLQRAATVMLLLKVAPWKEEKSYSCAGCLLSGLAHKAELAGCLAAFFSCEVLWVQHVR